MKKRKIDNETKEKIDSFVSEGYDLIEDAEEKIIDLDAVHNKEVINTVFRMFHSIKGTAGYLNFKNIKKVTHEAGVLLDIFRKRDIDPNPETVDLLYQTLDFLKQLIMNVEEELTDEGFEEHSNIIIHNIYDCIKSLSLELDKNDFNKESPLEDQNKKENKKKKNKEKNKTKEEIDQDVVEKTLEIQNSMKPGNTSYGASYGDIDFGRKNIRIDTRKLDFLFDTVGELFTASAMVINNPDLSGLKLENFRKSAARLGKVTRDIQEIILSIRMIPLENLFIKMKRLVSDLLKKFDKKIQFNISGQDTEIDRNVIEQISDPLVHILRNAIEHGIENKETRLKNHKEEIGTVNLSAKYEGNEIWIIIEDDGAGLDRDKIMNQAIENNLFKGDPYKLVDEEVWNFIFQTGFTTIDKVFDVSGRGVGLDVVKRNIEKLRGNIKIESKIGKGTTFILKIPLTMAIMEGITLKVGDNLYSIPTIDIQEFFEVEESQITKTETNNYIIKLRKEKLPVIKLFEVFNIRTKKNKLTDGIIVVVKNDNKKACLLVDEVLGNHQIVVKSLSDYPRNVDGISGCTIMGDGEVSLIIDTESLLNKCIE
jgi:two-component system chemotaxis sensor kinase CheA